jgi:hypothetical protein
LQGLYETLNLEYIGLPKLDLLGLKLHTASTRQVDLEEVGQEDRSLQSAPDDKETY